MRGKNGGKKTSYGASAKKSKLSKPKETMRNNNENNKHPCAGAQKSKLSKPQAGIFINNGNN